MSAAPVAERGAAIVAFVEAYLADHGYCPSMREIGDAVGLSSSNSVKFQVDKLVCLGLLLQTPGVPRSIRPPL